MVGGGSRKDSGGQNGVSSTNVFAALDSLRKKKKSEQSKSIGGAGSNAQDKKADAGQVYWEPAPLTVKSWADVDDDDDYFATAPPPQLPAAWGNPESEKSKETDDLLLEEETESEDDGLEDGDDADDDREKEQNVEFQTETGVEPTPSSFAQKETERQLSKKELKKKELAELDAVLAELGITDKDKTDNSLEELQAKKPEPPNGDVPQENVCVPSESKASKKKKKKSKAPKEGKDTQEQPGGPEINTTEEDVANQSDDASNLNMKERLKKIASMKKKKSSKEMDGAAKVAAEAAARNAKLAAAKKKEKSHYNQQPVR